MVVPRLASSLTALETLHNVHRFTLVDQITLKIAFCGLIGQSSSPVQYSSPVVQSSEWIHPCSEVMQHWIKTYIISALASQIQCAVSAPAAGYNRDRTSPPPTLHAISSPCPCTAMSIFHTTTTTTTRTVDFIVLTTRITECLGPPSQHNYVYSYMYQSCAMGMTMNYHPQEAPIGFFQLMRLEMWEGVIMSECTLYSSVLCRSLVIPCKLKYWVRKLSRK